MCCMTDGDPWSVKVDQTRRFFGAMFVDLQKKSSSHNVLLSLQKNSFGETFATNQCSGLEDIAFCTDKNEPHHEKTNDLHMRKQRRRSASR